MRKFIVTLTAPATMIGELVLHARDTAHAAEMAQDLAQDTRNVEWTFQDDLEPAQIVDVLEA